MQCHITPHQLHDAFLMSQVKDTLSARPQPNNRSNARRRGSFNTEDAGRTRKALRFCLGGDRDGTKTEPSKGLKSRLGGSMERLRRLQRREDRTKEANDDEPHILAPSDDFFDALLPLHELPLTGQPSTSPGTGILTFCNPKDPLDAAYGHI